MSKRLTTTEFISKAKLIHGNKYDYSKTKYVDANTKVCIVCPIHGEFWQIPRSHLSGRGCYNCGRQYTAKKNSDDYTSFIAKAKLTHNERYNYSCVMYIDSKTQVEIICKEHGSFFQTPANHIRGQGCPKCKYESQKKLLYGVGNYDSFSESSSLSARIWRGILSRCYESNEKYKAYQDCFVCDEWHTFSNFDKWFKQHYKDGYEIDKDILIKGNKIYSPDTCCFVPHAINQVIVNRRNFRGVFPLGVSPCGKKYRAQVYMNNTTIHLGVFNTQEDAFNAYKLAKEKHIKELAEKYFNEGKITQKVYNALMKYEVDIGD